MSGRVEIEGGQVIEFRQIKPVKWSTIDNQAGTYRHAFVRLFLKYEGCPLLDEDGERLLDGSGRPRKVNVTEFARHMNISKRTFQDWVFEERGYSEHPNSRRQAKVGAVSAPTCRHCPIHCAEGG